MGNRAVVHFAGQAKEAAAVPAVVASLTCPRLINGSEPSAPSVIAGSAYKRPSLDADDGSPKTWLEDCRRVTSRGNAIRATNSTALLSIRTRGGGVGGLGAALGGVLVASMMSACMA